MNLIFAGSQTELQTKFLLCGILNYVLLLQILGHYRSIQLSNQDERQESSLPDYSRLDMFKFYFLPCNCLVETYCRRYDFNPIFVKIPIKNDIIFNPNGARGTFFRLLGLKNFKGPKDSNFSIRGVFDPAEPFWPNSFTVRSVEPISLLKNIEKG